MSLIGLGLIGVIGLSLISYNGLIGVIGLSLISHIISLIGLNGFSLVGLIGRSGISGLVDHTGLDDIGLNGLVDFMGLNLVGFIGLGFAGFTSLGIISLVGLIRHISLVSLGGFSGINTRSLVKLIGHISLVSFIGFNGWLACARKKVWWWIASLCYSNHYDMFSYPLTTAIQIAAAETIPQRRMQAAHRLLRCQVQQKSGMPQFIFIANAMLICL
jgi:hypothetical protein